MTQWRSPAARENSRRLSLEAKRRRTGTCVDCGAVTRYNGTHGLAVSARCPACAAALIGRQRRGTGPRGQQIVQLIQQGCVRFSDMRDAMEVSNGHMGQNLDRLLKYGVIRRVGRGIYAIPDDTA